MSDPCSVCLCPIDDTESWKIPCGHVYHKKCIQKVYEMNINCVDEQTGHRIKPMCPYCRAILHKKDLPPWPKIVNLNILNEPAYGSMPVDQRPLRLARETAVIRRENTRRLIDELVARRRQILNARGPLLENQTGNSGAHHQASQNETDSCNRGGSIVDLVVVPSQDSGPSQAPPAIIETSQHSRSRSPNSQQSVLTTASPRLQANPELQDVQMEINILQAQLDNVNELPARPQVELIDISDSESEDSETEHIAPIDFSRVRPVEVCGHFGRGRNIKYIVKWSDNREFLVKKSVVIQLDEVLLKNYKRKTLAHNTRECRRRAKERSRTDDAI